MGTNRPRGRGPAALALCLVTLGLPPAPRRARAESPGATGEVRRFEGMPEPVLDVAFLPDGRRFVAATGLPGAPGTDHAVHLWDSETGKEIRRFDGHEKAVNCVTVSPDGAVV